MTRSRVKTVTAVAAVGAGLATLASFGASAQPAHQAPTAPTSGGGSVIHVTNQKSTLDAFTLPNGKKAKVSLAAPDVSTGNKARARLAEEPSVPTDEHRLALADLKPGQHFEDVSHWQGDIDWTKFAAYVKSQQPGVEHPSVIIRAAFGTSVDDQVKDNYCGAVKNGLTPTLYTAVTPAQSPKSQADTLVSVQRSLEKACPPPEYSTEMFDVEDGAALNTTAARRSELLMEEMKEVKAQTGDPIRNMLLYTGAWDWNPHYASPRFGPEGRNPNQILANYNYSPGDSIHSIPWATGLGEPDVVQYTSSSHLPGITANTVDQNVVIMPLHNIPPKSS